MSRSASVKIRSCGWKWKSRRRGYHTRSTCRSTFRRVSAGVLSRCAAAVRELAGGRYTAAAIRHFLDRDGYEFSLVDALANETIDDVLVHGFLAEQLHFPKDPVEGLLALAMQASFMQLVGRTVVVGRAPVTLEVDTIGRLHCTDGPAACFAYGTALYAVAGVHMEARHFGENPLIRASDIIGERNQEVRWVLLERWHPWDAPGGGFRVEGARKGRGGEMRPLLLGKLLDGHLDRLHPLVFLSATVPEILRRVPGARMRCARGR